MSVLIKGMDMPKNDSWVNVRIKEKDGKPIIAFITGEDLEGKYFEIEEVPTPHGTLIDKEVAIETFKEVYCGHCKKEIPCFVCSVPIALDVLNDIPTIIEAEVSEE